MNDMNHEENIKVASLSDDAVDAIAAVTLVGVTLAALLFWLNGMPY